MEQLPNQIHSDRGKAKGAGIAAVVTAVLASACCLGPAILLALGIGGLGFASALAPYRPFFLGLTALFLAGAFYMAYRPLKDEACASEGNCTPRSRRRTRLLVWVAAVLALGAGSYPYLAGANAGQSSGIEGVSTVELQISGMTCSACATHIRESLETVPGVAEAVVRYPEADASIQLDAPVEGKALLDAVRRAGYKATLKPQEDDRG